MATSAAPPSTSGDPLGEAIVAQGLDDQPLDETSEQPVHVRRISEEAEEIAAASPSPRRSGHDDAKDGEEEDEDEDFVVFDAKDAKLGPSKHPSSSSPANNQGHDDTRGRSRSASIDSVSFGFRDNLLPLSLSGKEYDDDDDDDGYDGDANRGLRSGNSASRQEYGEIEGSVGASGGSSTFRRSRRTRRYKDPERRMGLVDGIALTVGLQIGSGIFSSPGVVTLNVGSIGASLVVWIASGLLAWCGASSFAELAAAIPQNGGAQAYLNYAFGPLPSYLFSWTAIVALKPGSGAIISIIFGEYLARIIFHATSSSADHPHEQGLDGIPDWSIKIIACSIVVLVSTLNALSARLGTRLQVATTFVKLAALVAVPILAIVFVVRGKMPPTSSNAFSSVPALFEHSSPAPSSYALALYSGLWAFDGWDQASYVSAEMKSASRDLPRVIHSSMTLVLLFFAVTVLSYFLVLPPALVGRTNTVALNFGSAVFGGSTSAGVVFALLVAFSCFGALNSQIYTTSRLIYAAGKEGYLPATFGQINGRTATPVAATVFQAILVIIFILLGSGFASLVSFYGVCSYTWYFLTVCGLLALRVKEPNLDRPYRVWLITPIIFATTALFLLVMPIASAPIEAAAALAFIAAGLPAYAVSTGAWRGLADKMPWRSGNRERSGSDHPTQALGSSLHDEDDDEGRHGDDEEAMEMLARPSSDLPASAAGHGRYTRNDKGKGRQMSQDDDR